MKTIPNCFYNKSLKKLIDNCIDDGFASYSSLDDIDKELIAAECIDALGDDSYPCIIEPAQFSQLLNHFTKFLRTAQSEYSNDLAQTMSKNATDYFADDMDHLFSERVSERKSEMMYEDGFRPEVDRVNGEISWRKFA